jgi:uncharacterized protein (UPF0332 family)
MFRGEEFLEVARSLASGDDEAGWRSAVSRAYYAAFWVAREIVERDGVPPPRSGGEHSHDALWDMFMGDYNMRGFALGDIGRDLQSHRTRADYRTRQIVANDAQQAVERAEAFIADLRALT